MLGSGIPDKGKVLTQISAFWFDRTRALVANHVISTEPGAFPPEARGAAGDLRGRSMLVTRTEPLAIECVARGYLSGSGWKDYAATGEICGIRLPAGLHESEQLPEPIFTPATKAQSGHDINITEAQAADDRGPRVSPLGTDPPSTRQAPLTPLRAASSSPTRRSNSAAAGTGDVILIDEAVTPDSSRFWPRDGYRPGGPQPSFDKQFVRDYLERIRWNKQPPVPSLPDDVVAKTREKYLEAFTRLTGRTLE